MKTRKPYANYWYLVGLLSFAALSVVAVWYNLLLLLAILPTAAFGLGAMLNIQSVTVNNGSTREKVDDDKG